MDTSIFFARFLGLYILILGLAMLYHRDRMEGIVRESMSPAWMLFTGALAVIFGLVIVLLHNVWVAHWPVLITLVGWLCLLKGFFRLFLPDQVQEMARSVSKPAMLVPISIGTIILGGVLTYFGFAG